MEITPVISIDKYTVGNAEAGSITEKIHKLYLEMAVGKNKNIFDWVTPIY